MTGTKAIDLFCPACLAAPGERCPGDTICKKRRDAASRVTREANRAAKAAALALGVVDAPRLPSDECRIVASEIHPPVAGRSRYRKT